jgi:ABC-type nitrate/sulfonate/bicarbonate transport system substrate-binding protein
LTAGNVDAVTNAETQAILRSIANPEIRVILTVAGYGYRIVACRSAGVRTAIDLRGKKIATSLNSSAHFYIVKTLQSAGLSEADVTVVGMTPPECRRHSRVVTWTRSRSGSRPSNSQPGRSALMP